MYRCGLHSVFLNKAAANLASQGGGSRSSKRGFGSLYEIGNPGIRLDKKNVGLRTIEEKIIV